MQLLVNQVFIMKGQTLRVLHTAGTLVNCIDIKSEKNTFPFRLSFAELEVAFLEESAKRIDDPFLPSTTDIKEKHMSIATHRFESIKPMLDYEGLFYKNERYKILKKCSEKTGVHKYSLYNWLVLYWQRGMSLYALLPDYPLCGGKGKERTVSSARGRKRKNIAGHAPLITKEIKGIFRRVIDTYILSKKKYSLAYAARRAQAIFLSLYPDTPEKELPTYEQVRYFFNKETSIADKAKEKALYHEYANDVRPIEGTATQSSLGPGSKFEIDATIADIYLVSDKDATLIIGRPTLYLLVDTFSRLIVGFHIGMESPSYVTAMRAVKTVIEDWRFIESELDLEFEDQYFHQAGLPDTLHADRGELLGHQVNLLSMMHSIILEFSPPFHAVSKAIVERHFRSAQADFKQFVPGVVENTTVKKRGGRDYRLDATLNLKEFKQIIFSSIILHNNFHTVKIMTEVAICQIFLPYQWCFGSGDYKIEREGCDRLIHMISLWLYYHEKRFQLMIKAFICTGCITPVKNFSTAVGCIEVRKLAAPKDLKPLMIPRMQIEFIYLSNIKNWKYGHAI